MLKCGGCQRSLGTGVNLRCKKCKEVFYCDARCQKVAWPVHKRSCKLVTDKLQSDRLVLKTLKELYVVNDFHGVLSMKESAMTIAAKLQENWHGHTQHVDYVAVQDHVSRVYTILGASMRSMGQYREAYEMYMLAKAALDAIDDPFHISKSAVFIAIVQVLMDLNRTEEALEINRAIVARWQNSTMHLQMIAHSGLASCLTKIGKYEEASESYQKQVDMAIALGDKIEEAGALDGFANNLMLLGQNERAYELFERCRALALNHVEVHESFSLRVIVGMASSLWNQVCCCDAVTKKILLLMMGEHVKEACAMVTASTSPGYDRMDMERGLLLSAFYLRVVGDVVEAKSHMCLLLGLISQNSRKCCVTCGRGRDPKNRLLRCGCCLVVRFCSIECRDVGSSDTTSNYNNNNVTQHKRLCKTLRTYRHLNTLRECSEEDEDEDNDDASAPSAPSDASTENRIYKVTLFHILDRQINKFLDRSTARCT